jgi:hypothetical protein
VGRAETFGHKYADIMGSGQGRDSGQIYMAVDRAQILGSLKG